MHSVNYTYRFKLAVICWGFVAERWQLYFHLRWVSSLLVMWDMLKLKLLQIPSMFTTIWRSYWNRPSSNYPAKSLHYHLRRLSTAGQSKMTNATIPILSQHIGLWPMYYCTLYKRLQQLYNLKIFSSEESTKTVQRQNVQLGWRRRTWCQGLHRPLRRDSKTREMALK